MPNHYHTKNSQLKKSAGKPPADAKAGSKSSAPEKTITWPSVPTGGGNPFSRMRKGTPTTKQYVTSRGLA